MITKIGKITGVRLGPDLAHLAQIEDPTKQRAKFLKVMRAKSREKKTSRPLGIAAGLGAGTAVGGLLRRTPLQYGAVDVLTKTKGVGAIMQDVANSTRRGKSLIPPKAMMSIVSAGLGGIIAGKLINRDNAAIDLARHLTRQPPNSHEVNDALATYVEKAEKWGTQSSPSMKGILANAGLTGLVGPELASAITKRKELCRYSSFF